MAHDGAGRSRHATAAVVACAILLVGCVAGVFAVFVIQARDDADDQARQDRVLDTARQAVVLLTSIHPDTAHDDTKQILAVSTGEFESAFSMRAGPVAKAVEASGVVADGTVLSSGIEHIDDSSATVLVAAEQKLTPPAGDPEAPADAAPPPPADAPAPAPAAAEDPASPDAATVAQHAETRTYRFRVVVDAPPAGSGDAPAVSKLEFVR